MLRLDRLTVACFGKRRSGCGWQTPWHQLTGTSKQNHRASSWQPQCRVSGQATARRGKTQPDPLLTTRRHCLNVSRLGDHLSINMQQPGLDVEDDKDGNVVRRGKLKSNMWYTHHQDGPGLHSCWGGMSLWKGSLLSLGTTSKRFTFFSLASVD